MKKKVLNTTVKAILVIVCLIALDMLCIYTLNTPIFAIKDNCECSDITYKGLLYNTYKCLELPKAQIKPKWVKYNCSESVTFNIIDKTVGTSISVPTALEKFYEDDKNEYYFSNVKSNYVVVRYINGYEETVKEALEYGKITMDDLKDAKINYITKPKENIDISMLFGIVTKIDKNYVIVKVSKTTNVLRINEEAHISLNNINTKSSLKVGDEIKVKPMQIMETYPPVIITDKIEVVDSN